ncbi:MAG: DUF3379 family protein [Gammaproteobacteria bacterium]
MARENREDGGVRIRDCADARLLIGADPLPGKQAPLPDELSQHLANCAACTAYQQEMQALERAIQSALGVRRMEASPQISPVPASRTNLLENGPRKNVPAASGRWRPAPLWALAASMLAAIGLAAFLLISRPVDALADDVVSHMAHELDSWDGTLPVPDDILARVLSRSGVRLDRLAAGDIVYAQSCWFRGNYVPHLVVRTTTGPVTVMILPDEHIARPHDFNEGGYSGVLMPTAHGGIAVLGRGVADVAEPAERIRQALL